MSELLQDARFFWYQNVPGAFGLDREPITRRDIHIYGGPSPQFDGCEACQKSEWLSRVRQKNLFVDHSCKTSVECRKRCSKQGNQLWTHAHQNHFFALGCDPQLPAARVLCVFRQSGAAKLYQRYWRRSCDSWMSVLRRQFAQTCQVTVKRPHENIPWQDFDFVFFMNTGQDPKLTIPDSVPIVMYMHDMWIGNFQRVIDLYNPRYILTPNPAMLSNNYRTGDSEVWFYPVAPSMFFSRPNLGKKLLDLLSVGSLNSYLYEPRRQLDEQLRQLRSRFKVSASHWHGAPRSEYGGPTRMRKGPDSPLFLNKWSEKLGSAQFVVFASFSDKRFQPTFMKHYEALASGTVPILPASPDLHRLGIKPMVHYIPLAKVWRNNKALAKFLSHYSEYRPIAVNAVKWARENMDRMLFDGFEDLVQEVTVQKYPRRLIE